MFVDTLRFGNKSPRDGEASVKEEVTKFVFYKSKETKKEVEMNRFSKAWVGVVKKPGLAYGVNQSLLEEGIFSVTATPLGTNLCLLEEKIEGDLELLLKDAGEWK